MTEFEKGLIQDYKASLAHIEQTTASVHGVLTKRDIDYRDRLEMQLVNRGLSHVMSAEALSNYCYHHNRPMRQAAP